MLEQTLMQRAAAVSGKTAGVFVERNAHVK
jgi:hypothetical protein